MKTTHTPAPWNFNDAGKNSGNLIRAEILSPHAEVICELPDSALEESSFISEEQFISNGCLIAAAPDLLKALQAQEILQANAPAKAAKLLGIADEVRAHGVRWMLGYVDDLRERALKLALKGAPF